VHCSPLPGTSTKLSQRSPSSQRSVATSSCQSKVLPAHKQALPGPATCRSRSSRSSSIWADARRALCAASLGAVGDATPPPLGAARGRLNTSFQPTYWAWDGAQVLMSSLRGEAAWEWPWVARQSVESTASTLGRDVHQRALPVKGRYAPGRRLHLRSDIGTRLRRERRLRIAKAPGAMLAANSRACTAAQAGVAGDGGPDARGLGSGERAPAPRSGDDQQVKGCSTRGRAGQACLCDRAPPITTGSPKRRPEIVCPGARARM